MQLIDDPKSKHLIELVAKYKAEHRGIISESARKLGKSDKHMRKVATGNVPYSIQNVRLLRQLANMYQALESKVIELTTMDSPMRA